MTDYSLTEAQAQILKIIQEHGPLSQKEIAEHADVAYGTVRNYMPELINRLHLIEKTPHGYVMSEQSNGLGDEMALLPLWDVRASAGPGERPVYEVVEGYMAYPAASMRRELGVRPGAAGVMTVTGDSMEPTLRAGDRVVVAYQNGDPIYDRAIYVVSLDGIGVLVKRFHQMGDRTWQLRGDGNGDDITVSPDMEDDLRIIGRVTQIIRHA